MVSITLKGDGNPARTDLLIDGQEPRGVSSLALRVAAGHVTELDVEYVAPSFDIQQDGVFMRCSGTELSEDEERAVLTYLQDKYRE